MASGEIRYRPYFEDDPERGGIWLREFYDDPQVELVQVNEPRPGSQDAFLVVVGAPAVIRDEPLEAAFTERLERMLAAVPGVTGVSRSSHRQGWHVRGDPAGEALIRSAIAVVSEFEDQIREQIPDYDVWLAEFDEQGKLAQCALCGRKHPPGPPHRIPWIALPPPAWGGIPPRFQECEAFYQVWATGDEVGSSLDFNPDLQVNQGEIVDNLIATIGQYVDFNPRSIPMPAQVFCRWNPIWFHLAQGSTPTMARAPKART